MASVKYGQYSVPSDWKARDGIKYLKVSKLRKQIGEIRKSELNVCTFALFRTQEELVYLKEGWTLARDIIPMLRCFNVSQLEMVVSNGDFYCIPLNQFDLLKKYALVGKVGSFPVWVVAFDKWVLVKGKPETLAEELHIGRWK